jgi:hypothetical protein
MAGLEPQSLGRPLSYHRADMDPRAGGPANLADILERVLDKGIVIAGDIQINLLDIELLTIRLRLLITSVDRAREMGINWWEGDPMLSAGAKKLESENKQLHERLQRLERAIGAAAADEQPTAEASAAGENATAEATVDGEKTTAQASTDDDG